MTAASQDLSYFLGGLALMSAVTSLGLYSRSYLPNAQIKILDELLHETGQIYEKSDAEDLIPNDSKAEFRGTLTRLVHLAPRLSEWGSSNSIPSLEGEREELRERAYRAITVFEQYMALFQGLSRDYEVFRWCKDTTSWSCCKLYSDIHHASPCTKLLNRPRAKIPSDGGKKPAAAAQKYSLESISPLPVPMNL